jgi:hypothetical protein
MGVRAGDGLPVLPDLKGNKSRDKSRGHAAGDKSQLGQTAGRGRSGGGADLGEGQTAGGQTPGRTDCEGQMAAGADPGRDKPAGRGRPGGGQTAAGGKSQRGQNAGRGGPRRGADLGAGQTAGRTGRGGARKAKWVTVHGVLPLRASVGLLDDYRRHASPADGDVVVLARSSSPLQRSQRASRGASRAGGKASRGASWRHHKCDCLARAAVREALVSPLRRRPSGTTLYVGRAHTPGANVHAGAALPEKRTGRGCGGCTDRVWADGAAAGRATASTIGAATASTIGAATARPWLRRMRRPRVVQVTRFWFGARPLWLGP